MITNTDIIKLKEVFATKEDLKKTSSDLIEYIDLVRKDLRHEFKSEINSFRSEVKHDILTFKDEILTEIRAMRQEISIVVSYRGILENHEHRIQKLESENIH